MRNSGSIEKVRENFAKRGLEMTKEILFQPCLTTIYAKLFQKEFKHELSDTATIAKHSRRPYLIKNLLQSRRFL